MTTPTQWLTECETMLAQISARYGTTIARLRDASFGFPARTPGSGEPGGGKGFTAGSITERLAITGYGPELATLTTALALPGFIRQAATTTAEGVTMSLADLKPATPRQTVNDLRLARCYVHEILAQRVVPSSTTLERLHRHITELHAITTNWGGPLRTPKKQDDLIPDDPTQRWCTSCLRIQMHSPRQRGDRCGWCYNFELVEHFPPPVELLEKRHRGKRIYDRDIDPHRKMWRDKQKQRKRKKAG